VFVELTCRNRLSSRNCEVEKKAGCIFQIGRDNNKISFDIIGRGATALQPALQTPSQKLGGPLLIEGKLLKTMPETK